MSKEKLYVCSTNHPGGFWDNWGTEDACLENDFELVKTHNIEDYAWESMCQDASAYDHDEDEIEWSEHVENNAYFVAFEYNPEREGHVELKGYEDERPEYAKLMAKRAAKAKLERIAELEKDLVEHQGSITKLTLIMAFKSKELKELRNE